MSGGVRFDMKGARAKLQQVVEGLRAAASGEVVERAAAKVRTQIDKVGHKYASAHRLTGAADSGLVTTTSGGLIQLTANRYLSYHSWWPFRSGMPPFVVTRAAKIFAAELQAAISGQASPLALADAAAEESAAAKVAKAVAKAAREDLRVKAAAERERNATQKLRDRLAKVQTRAKDRWARKAERAHDKRVKAQEDRE